MYLQSERDSSVTHNEETGSGKFNTHRVLNVKEAEGKHQVIYLMGLCKWVAEQGGEE